MRQGLRSVEILLPFLFVFLTKASTEAQQAFRTTRGAVNNLAGATLSGTRVTVTDLATSLATDPTTNSAGEYSASNLLPGQYGVAAPDFKESHPQPLILLVDKTLCVDAVLQLASVKSLRSDCFLQRPFHPSQTLS